LGEYLGFEDAERLAAQYGPETKEPGAFLLQFVQTIDRELEELCGPGC